MVFSTSAVRQHVEKRPMSSAERKVIFASSLGTVFEWYDFYLYGSLASIIGAQFFSQFPKTTADIFALLAFAAGFLVRPFGALVFGRLGDLVGRKYTFLVTILIMGLSTFVVGLLPNYDSIGIAAPIILISARLLQGLALGGEYGGAATYVAEHAPHGRRGFYTSWIQTTATLGLFLSLLVILGTRTFFGEARFAEIGWRVPFIVSVLLLLVSLWIRLQLSESPAFLKMKEEGTVSEKPLTEAFATWSNAKIALLALFGLTMGQGVVWYTGQFYSLFFLQSICKVDGYTANLLIAWALVCGTGFFVFFGWLSDHIGRKPIILTGCLLAALTYFPIYRAITANANPALAQALETVKVKVVADPADCGNLFNPVGTRVFTSSCDIARDFLAKSAVRYEMVPGPAGSPAQIVADGVNVTAFDSTQVSNAKTAMADFSKTATAALQEAGYPKPNDPGIIRMKHPFDLSEPRVLHLIGLLAILVIYVTMVYGPIAAALVELFPTRIRYTSMSLPYHIGNGWFGGLLPATAFAMVAQTGDIYYGLWYPIIFAGITFVIGSLFIPETKDRDIYAED
ncbi:MFS transporter [Beijerinckia indica]|uniref:Major facilitator superfamily MFS_1 n=1 Tax=Beijerinckia indica subsp. indica (strain ATCC 9039 / DSM 1715 / NCIMB 8712) TaxID=395963 RepID=B2IK42_BEII9|nr:MFS transporter [Beijerinckia indica]ACB94974.1 major facilitator superfamily MFS_1 [Beijerinckia indica subsp. indica ATCC 9039]